MKDMLLNAAKLWTSLFYGSSWVAVILAVICFMSGAGAAIVIGMILFTYGIGGFFVIHQVKKGIKAWENGNHNSPSPNYNGEHKLINVNSTSSSDHIVVDGKMYKKEGNGYRFIGDIH